MSASLPPTHLLDLLRLSLTRWLAKHPAFARSEATASLRLRLCQAEVPSPEQVPHLIEQLQTDIVRLQVAFHEAGHAATTSALTPEDDVWDLHLWFADDPEQDHDSGEVHAGRTYTVERHGWPSSLADLRTRIATILAGALFHPHLPGITFTGAEQGDELAATAKVLGRCLERPTTATETA